MVFHCRCFSFELEQQDEEIETETQTQTKSTTTATFYTAHSDLGRSVHGSQTSEVSNLAEKKKPSNLRVFTVDELKAATNNFCRESKIGEGRFGSVFRGVIKGFEHPDDEIQVAVKRAKEVLQGHEDWLTEINVLGGVEHSNLVKLVGYCAEDNERGRHLHLVYEYIPSKSVRDHLSNSMVETLPWTMRPKVAQDAACCLAYLHEEIGSQIIFRNFKSCNILLDDQWNVKLSDFGVAQMSGPDQKAIIDISTKLVVGSMECAAPEYIAIGHLTSKSDVWSYGVFLYELITGRCPFDKKHPQEEQYVKEWVNPKLSLKRFHQILDPRLQDSYTLKSAQKLAIIANKCLSENPKSRPKMSEVLVMVNQLIPPRTRSSNLLKHFFNNDCCCVS